MQEDCDELERREVMLKFKVDIAETYKRTVD